MNKEQIYENTKEKIKESLAILNMLEDEYQSYFEEETILYMSHKILDNLKRINSKLNRNKIQKNDFDNFFVNSLKLKALIFSVAKMREKDYDTQEAAKILLKNAQDILENYLEAIRIL